MQPIPEDAPPFVGGAFGLLSYDAVRGFEPSVGQRAGTFPDALFLHPRLLAVFDNRHHTLTLHGASSALLDDAARRLRAPWPAHVPFPKLPPPQVAPDRGRYEEMVRIALEHIRAGDIVQAVLSRSFVFPGVDDLLDLYRGLRTINPSPYLFLFQTPEVQVAGASPEVMVRAERGRAHIRPIAGTRPRGSTAQEDDAFADALLRDEKERAEHVMLVDLGRNDLGRVCRPGTVSVPNFMRIERYSHVMHMVSDVEGNLAVPAVDALRACFPAGTLSGAPKIRAMQIIDALEAQCRGLYGGAVGTIGRDAVNFGIAIRTAVNFDGTLRVQAGAGVVADSDPGREAAECEHKAEGVLRAIAWAQSALARWS
jgi:anthranilate synthase component 1